MACNVSSSLRSFSIFFAIDCSRFSSVSRRIAALSDAYSGMPPLFVVIIGKPAVIDSITVSGAASLHTDGNTAKSHPR